MNFVRLLRNTERLKTVNGLRYSSILSYPSRNKPHMMVIQFTDNDYNYRQKRHYKNFGHKPENETNFQKVFYMTLTIMGVGFLIDYRW